MKLTFLGTGTSSGIPLIACTCTVCTSKDIKDKRLRCSVLLEWNNNKIIIDAGIDFRQQMLRENIQQLDAVLITHAHIDHIGGLDELRAFNFKLGKDMPIYVDNLASLMIKNMFAYAFQKNKYPGTPNLILNTFTEDSFRIADKFIQPIKVLHGKMPISAFRIDNFTYITDGKYINEEEKSKIKGTETLIINAVRTEYHHSHFNLDEALAFIEEMKVKRAYLIHISHRFAKHKDIEAVLPKHVHVAYDGLTLEV